jgi:hypothetical protein
MAGKLRSGGATLDSGAQHVDVEWFDAWHIHGVCFLKMF